MRLGVLGGTFDPIHLGHLAAAEAAIECADLDQVVFVPTGTPPHRPRATASGEQRLEMCRLATAGDSRFSISNIELERESPAVHARYAPGAARGEPARGGVPGPRLGRSLAAAIVVPAR